MKALGLAKGPDGWWWWWVEERTARLFMLYIVGSICRCEHGLFPVTDTRLSLSALTESFDDKPFRLQNLKLSVIRGALPTPSAPVPPKELASFKGTHEAQLRKLHNYLNEKLKELATLDNDQLREDEIPKILAEIRDDVKVLQEQMSKKQWPKIILTGVGGVIVGGLSVGAAVATGGTALALALGVAAATGAQVPAAAGIAKSIHFKNEAPGKPLAYAALVKEELDTHVNMSPEGGVSPVDQPEPNPQERNRRRGFLRHPLAAIKRHFKEEG